MNKQKKSSVVKASDHPDKRRDRLAEAFPLLFGKTAEDRSTLGKYTSNKDKLLTKRAPVDFSDENSAPSNAQNNVDFSRTTPLKQPTSAKKAARRSSFLSMSSLKHKSSTQQSKLSKTICITSPQPRGLELIEDKKFSNASLNSTQVTDYNLQSEQGDRNSTVVNLVAALSPEKPLENKIAPSSATNIASPTIVRSNEHEIFQQQSDIKPAVDDTAVIVALRNFISTMESNDTEQTKNESNFQTIDAATSIPTTEEAITTNVEPTVNEYITLESEIKIAGDEKGMVILPDLHIDSRRTSSSSYVSSAYNSQRSSLCTEHVPVTDEYVSNALGDKDIVPARNSNSTAEKILVHPRFTMMNEAMIHGLVVVEVYDRIQFENHTKFILNVQVRYKTKTVFIFPFETHELINHLSFLHTYVGVIDSNNI
jgi:ribosomal protein L32